MAHEAKEFLFVIAPDQYDFLSGFAEFSQVFDHRPGTWSLVDKVTDQNEAIRSIKTDFPQKPVQRLETTVNVSDDDVTHWIEPFTRTLTSVPMID